MMERSANTNIDIASDLDVPRLALTESVIRNFRFSKVFRENSARINAMSFNLGGDLLITSSDDESIVIYDCMQGTSKRALNSKKYGVDLIRYTHAPSTAIHASTKVDDSIRYLSLHDNKYIRYYSGHQNKVTGLVMSPLEDIFLSCSLDNTLRLWDLRSQNCQGLMHLQGRAIANFDPDGIVFAVGVNSEKLNLYDLRSFDKGPFSTFRITSTQTELSSAPTSSSESTVSSANSHSGPNSTLNIEGNPTAEWVSVRFSPDERRIALLTSDEQIRLLDAFSGTLTQHFTVRDSSFSSDGDSGTGPTVVCSTPQLTSSQIRTQVPQNVSFSPDSQFIFCGSSEGNVHGWDVKSGRQVAVLSNEHVGPVCHVEFNPKYMMLGSACTNLTFWLPDPDGKFI